MVEVDPGERVVLRSEPLPGGENRFAGTEDRFDILELRGADSLDAAPELPDRLASPPDLAEDEVAQTRHFRLSGTSINGLAMHMERIDHVAEVGTTEKWVVRNAYGQFHNFHVHDVQFQVLSLDGRRPPPEYTGWQDTVMVLPQQEVELLMRFEDYADPDTPYMFHCHLLRHEDEGMMGQFAVVEPGQAAGTPEHAEGDAGH